MKVLDTTSDVIKLVTGSAGAIDVDASWSDTTGTGSSATVVMNSAMIAQITTATTTTIVAAPASSHTLNLKFISIRNASATSANTVTVQHFDGTLTMTICSYTLQAGDALHYVEGAGWQYVPANNGAQVPGRLLAVTVLTAASGNFTTGHFTNSMRIEAVGGGGGGGGTTGFTSDAAAGGGGGAGGYGEWLTTCAPDTAYAYVNGAAGTSNSGLAGGNGGDTTFGPVSGVTLTAKGGTGAPVAAFSASLTVGSSGAGGVAGTGGQINASGMPGEPGFVFVVATPVAASGPGGSGPFGGGGKGVTAVGAGTAATGNGAGGSGSISTTANQAGGAGTGGQIVVYEYS